MEIKTEPEECYNFAQTSKVLNASSAHKQIAGIEIVDSKTMNPMLKQDDSVSCLASIKLEKDESNIENVFISNDGDSCDEASSKTFASSSCEYRTNQSTNAVIHYKSPRRKDHFKCLECRYRMKYLKKSPNGAEETFFKCDICQYTKEKMPNVVKNKQKYFYCSSCGYKFARKGHFQAFHEVICQREEKPFVCYLCDYKSVSQSALTDHLVTHIGDNPFPCSICNYRTNSNENLEAHVKTHKPFCCTKCAYRCATQPTLNAHLKTHGVKIKNNKFKEWLQGETRKKALENNEFAGLEQLQIVKTEEVYVNEVF